MTSHDALCHSFVAEPRGHDESDGPNADLLPVIKKNFNARKTLHAAIDTIRAINKLREGGAAAMMEGAMSVDPPRAVAGAGEGSVAASGAGGDRMEIDSRGNARGQTEEQIREQERRVRETSKGLWGAKGVD